MLTAKSVVRLNYGKAVNNALELCGAGSGDL
ncbi:hypothetical protein V1279_005998 [Bradyrhizobium sp. AZCC 1610]